MARAAIVSLVAALAGERRDASVAGLAVAASVVAIVLDGVDGRLARRTGMASPFGARFDMEIDALLILALSILAWQHDKAGAWVILAGLLRYGFVAATLVRPWMARSLPPSRRRQLICVVQMVALVVTLAPPIAPPYSAAIAALALALLSWSFFLDIAWLAQQT
jgi:phosphatidylglycerophosphate synthase